ncbi:hypothetical protein, partial [Metamycoplasma hyosynoviae]|uniref:hypothetical protein n=1 Tax=Metamycoplasma hyosynoviae TaxID=29559 RepID=UPI002359E893
LHKNIELFRKQENIDTIKNILKQNVSKVVDKLPDSILNYVSKPELINVLQVLLDNGKIYETIFDIIAKVNNDIASYSGLSLSNPVEILYKFVEKEKEYIKSKIKDIGKDFVSIDTNQDVIVKLIKANFNEYTGIGLSDTNNAFFKKLIKNLFEIFNNIKISGKPILDHILDIVFDNIRNPQKIATELAKPEFVSQLYSAPFLVSILNQQHIKDSKQDVIKLVKEIFMAFSSDETKIDKLLDKFKIVEIINKDPATQPVTKNLIKYIIKGTKTLDLLESILNTIFDSSEQLKNAKRWINVIKIIANSSHITSLKDKFKEFIIDLFNQNQGLLAKQIDVMLTQSWSSNPALYRKDVIAHNKEVIEKFMDSFFKSIVKEN